MKAFKVWGEGPENWRPIIHDRDADTSQSELFVTTEWCATWQIGSNSIVKMYLLTLLYTVMLTYTISHCFSNEADDFFLHDTRKSASSLCFSFQTLFLQSQQTSWFFTLVRLRPHRAVTSCQTREVKLIHTSTPAHILLSKRHDALLAERDSGDMGAQTAKQKQTLMTKWSPVPAWAAVEISFLSLCASRINNMSLHRSLWRRPPPYYCWWIESQGGVLQLIGVQIL